MDSVEARLAAIGWPVEEEDFGRADEPDVQGCLLIERVEGGVRARIVVRPGLQGDVRESFAEWAESRLQRFMEHGPEPDGWQKRSDGAWQMWARFHQMPSWE